MRSVARCSWGRRLSPLTLITLKRFQSEAGCWAFLRPAAFSLHSIQRCEQESEVLDLLEISHSNSFSCDVTGLEPKSCRFSVLLNLQDW